MAVAMVVAWACSWMVMAMGAVWGLQVVVASGDTRLGMVNFG